MAADQTIVDDLQRELLLHIREMRFQIAIGSDEEIQRRLPITYGDLVRRTGRTLPPNGIGKHLTELGDRCAYEGEPRLDHLVVSKKTRRPGKEISEAEWKRDVIAIFNCKTFQTLTGPET